MSGLLTGAGGRIPASVLTGFLGSGKTTVLNHLVRSPGMARALVIINEFGAVGLDHDLVARSNDDLVVEMIGGCLCCTIRGDLSRTLREAPWRFARDGQCWFDRVVIETTGLADPAPILHTLMTDPHLEALYRLDAVIATVDAATGMATFDTQSEAVKQAAVADRLLLTKTDLVDETVQRAIRVRLAALNPAAPVITVTDGAVDPSLLFGVGLWDPASKSDDVRRWLAEEAHHGGNHHHHHHDVNRHDDGIRATCLTFDTPLDPMAFERWLGLLTMFRGADLLRVKGIVNLAGHDAPVIVHGVQHVFHPPVELERWPSEDRRTRMVFITRRIDPEELRGTLALMTLGLSDVQLEGLVERVAADLPA
ncbi:GTP-binding protein [Sphingomonas ginsenosidimutans]|jgi:G3E family GTPase|uniref:GTP-binding protein n=1 Tax=Sphingomonas ginsenosidimutans TaxID=862134 RepID=A0A2A4HXQ0_9SPHN|nr:GTP-binding protein [Sphingomonas ginsenosidimutans]PCG08458.1 GTP-binding protein [Sphingomonas ginsenosidimutans]